MGGGRWAGSSRWWAVGGGGGLWAVGVGGGCGRWAVGGGWWAVGGGWWVVGSGRACVTASWFSFMFVSLSAAVGV